uniref:N-acetylglucosamine-1-phosphodiester alpha-N-acetylglucosaminidase isoform X2 n=1 Tax=Myxine glutinosa TaxID=7769 RepID=UPI00358FB1F5
MTRLNFPVRLSLFLYLSICIRDSYPSVSRVYTDDDLLMPYPDEDYSDNHVKWVYGLWTVVDDPVQLVTVLEPGGPGGCAVQRRETVTSTATSCGGCLFAVNAGFFRPATGACIGAIISNTQQVPGTQFSHNAAFGIRHDGSLVFGYVPPESVEQHGYWREFVAGVGWLVRNGKIYINESKEQECSDTQETGTIDRFINAPSARTVVGHDSYGRLIIVHIEGHTGYRGMNLWELAEFLVRRGVINAINLDGGGSATVVVNGTLVSYPSDTCPYEYMWRCERPVSSVLCVRAPELVCQPPCLHGHCVDGVCRCDGDWAGVDCNTPLCPAHCSGHGVCTAAGCECDPGWMGIICSQACYPGRYGRSCVNVCNCSQSCSCDRMTGSCSSSTDRNVPQEPMLNCFTSWLAEEQQKRIATEQFAWSMIFATAFLSVFLLLSIMGNVMAARRGCRPDDRTCHYQPLGKAKITPN